MPTLTTDIIAEVRSRVGDDTVGNYLMSDAAFVSRVEAANRKLVRYVRKDIEDATLATDGTSTSFTIPASVSAPSISDIWLRQGTDATTDREVRDVRIFNGKILFPSAPSNGYKIVFWYSGPYVLGTDTLPSNAYELLVELAMVEWYSYAIAKRSDFEQWSATNRSDTRISELRLAKRDLQEDIAATATDLGSTIRIMNVQD